MKTIAEFLVENKKKEHISFHMPGHKGRADLFDKAGYGEFYKSMLSEDITKIPGADTLFCPKTTIKAVMDNYADLYGVKHTELLVNGSSAGVIAAILASVPRYGKLILGRNSHHSAFSALRLGGIDPVYLRPEIIKEYNLVGGISPEEVRNACEDNPDASAILITSPNFCGMTSDISRIADIAHTYGMTLIVDQAHGAHLRFFDAVTQMRYAAEHLGADIVINSTHKTLLSLTESGILNVCTDRINVEELADCLRMLQSTSPSYLLLGSLDINERIMRRWGGDMVVSWMKDLTYAYSRLAAIRGVTVVECDCLDVTKINISLAEIGVSGEQLAKELRYKNIWVEAVYGDYVLVLTGAGNCREDYLKLIDAVRYIANNYAVGRTEHKPAQAGFDFELGVTEIPTKKELVPLYEADGRVLYNPIISYPPGTPVVCPGEIMNMEVIGYIARALEREEKISGVDEEGCVYVGVEDYR